jgi:stalled ribosome rescue protein Dom34
MEKTVKKEVGLWVDHRKAVVVTINGDIEHIQEISSNADKHVRFSSGTHSHSGDNSQGSTSEDVRDRQFGGQLESYYDAIISYIQDADSILLFGPGEAKVELESRIKHTKPEAHIVGVETVDKMTDPQVAAKVRDHYHGK